MKLGAYFAYIENGQYTQTYGNAPVSIEIFTFHQLSLEALQLVDKVRKASGIEIKVTGMESPFSI